MRTTSSWQAVFPNPSAYQTPGMQHTCSQLTLHCRLDITNLSLSAFPVVPGRSARRVSGRVNVHEDRQTLKRSVSRQSLAMLIVTCEACIRTGADFWASRSPSHRRTTNTGRILSLVSCASVGAAETRPQLSIQISKGTETSELEHGILPETLLESTWLGSTVSVCRGVNGTIFPMRS
jgi:hypothetical protein